MRTTALLIALLAGCRVAAADTPWKRHTIDSSSKGADGVRMLDANGDGLLDIATGWEQGGVTRIYLNPGHAKAGEPWPAVTVGKTTDVEDAVLVDLDGDGAMDVVSCMEGKTKRMSVHWAPQEGDRYLDPSAWTTETLPAADQWSRWMYCVPMDVDGKNGIDLVAGGKASNKNASDTAVGWFESPADPRKLADWKFHKISDAGWIMSIVPTDMDRDGDIDLLISDRYGPLKGCRWLGNPGGADAIRGPWKSHAVGAAEQVKFLDYADLDGDGKKDVVVGSEKEITFHRRLDDGGKQWRSHRIAMPENAGGYKAVTVADVNLDGRSDLVITCESASGGRHGVFYLRYAGAPTDAHWTFHPISGSDGVKHDLCPMVDLDGDGDLDVLTTEEVKSLGMIWYENPTKTIAAK